MFYAFILKEDLTPQGKKKKQTKNHQQQHNNFFFYAGAILIYVQFRSLQQTSSTNSSSLSSGTTCREFRPPVLLCVRGTRMLKYHVFDILVPVPHENEITLEFCLLLSIYFVIYFRVTYASLAQANVLPEMLRMFCK